MSGQVVVFDLDGVLVDSEPYWREGFRAAMAVIAADVGVAAPAIGDEELRRFEGGRVTDTVRALAASMAASMAGTDAADTTVDRAVDAAIARASSLFAEDPRAIAASVMTVTELRARGFRIGVASSSAPAFIEAVVTRLGLADAVEATASAFCLTNPKPHPDVYLDVLETMGVPPEAGTAVEDSWTGVQSALRAGLRTVWLTDEAAETAERRVQALTEGDPGSNGRPRPPLMITRVVDADAVQDFAEARP